MTEQISPQVVQARASVAQLAAERDRLITLSHGTGVVDRVGLSRLDAQIGGLLDGVLQLVDPCDASPSEPLVLLPVRLETRFGTVGGQTTLRVRIYPDEIHVDSLIRGLTDAETAAGQAYWSAVWPDPVPASAWGDLVSAVSPGRAEWVAHACTPANLAQRGATTAPAFTELPPPGDRRSVARALPDRFVVVAVQNGTVVQGVGRPVPRDLQISPIPMGDDQPTTTAQGIAVPAGSEWLVDYDLAVEVGMAVTLTLPSSGRVERVVAMGTRASTPAAAGADELEDLLTGHRFTDGLGILRQGTPTNNADAERSPYRSRPTPVAPPLTPVTPGPTSDATAAATVLGLDPRVVTDLLGPGTGEQDLARSVNTALWAPGWGDYLGHLADNQIDGLTDGQRESARDLFRDGVRGRGPAPAIRVGAQPYGILPVSDLRAWVPQPGETTAGIATVVAAATTGWLYAAQHKVPLVRPGTPDLDTTMLDVLGTSPVMQGLRVRPVISEWSSTAQTWAHGLSEQPYADEKTSVAAVAASVVGVAATRMAVGSLDVADRALPLPLVSPRDDAFIAALLGTPEQDLPIDSVFQALISIAWDATALDVAAASPATVLPQLLELATLDTTVKVQVAALAARADTASSAELHDVATSVQGLAPLAGPSLLARYQPLPNLQTSLAEVALSAPPTDEARQFGTAAIGAWIRFMGYRAEVRDALLALVGSDLEARRLAVAESLDCTSHRLDAWVTAVVSQRSSRQSARRTAAAGQSRGLTIGAYGIVEDLVPQATSGADGWIHAPSTKHAVAAGMLRSAHLSHLPAPGAGGAATGGGPFAIDLSSLRLRSAAHVLEGIRQGQQLSALIGYQIERGLTEARLGRLLLSLRAVAPLVARRLSDSDGIDEPSAQETVAAGNVVDGLLLLHLHAPGDPALRTLLDTRPANLYLDAAVPWPATTPDEWDAVTTVLRAAADTVDAVADVILSESVLQYAGGNPHRAAAAMDAMGTGADPADTMDVLEAQDSGERITHRVLAMIGGDATSGWSSSRPRAVADPRVEAWAAAHLGDPTTIVVAETADRRITLETAGFAALDLVFATSPVAFERALRVAIPGLGDAQLAIGRDPTWPQSLRGLGQVLTLAGTLRALLGGAHAVVPDDLAGVGEPPTRDLTAALPELVARMSGLAASFQGAVAALAPTIASIPEGDVVSDLDTAAALVAAISTLDAWAVPFDPTPARPLDVAWIRAAWLGAEARGTNAQATVDRMNGQPAGTPAAVLLECAQDVATGILGGGFLVLPRLPVLPGLPAGTTDRFVTAATDPAFAAPAATAVRRFVRDLGTVRTQVGRLSEALLLESALGHRRDLTVAQITGRTATGPGVGTDRWLAGPLPAAGPWPDGPVAHLVLDTVGTVAPGDGLLAGFVIDAWVEDLPMQVGPKARPEDPRPDRARTGLAVRAGAASARPPQTILSAVSPDGRPWTADTLRAVIEQTIDLARVRMVTLETLLGQGLMLPALYVRSASLQGQKYIRFSAAATSAYVGMPFVKETP